MSQYILLLLTYTMLLTRIAVINHKKILNNIRKSIKQYIEFMDTVPLKMSVGK